MHRRRTAWVTPMLPWLLGACGAGASSETPKVIAGAQLIDSIVEFQSGGLKQAGIVDAARDGARVAVVLAVVVTTLFDDPITLLDPYGNYAGEIPSGGSSMSSRKASVALSEDLGAHWTLHAPPVPNVVGVHLYEGRVFLLELIVRNTRSLQVWAWDPATNTATKVGDELRNAIVEARANVITHYDHEMILGGADPDTAPDAGAGVSYTWQALDLDTGLSSEKSRQPRAGEARCRGALSLASVDEGRSYQALTRCDTPEGMPKTCWVSVAPMPADPQQPWTADIDPVVARCEWAVDMPARRDGLARTDAGVATVDELERDGATHVVVWRYDADGSHTPVYLGTGAWRRDTRTSGLHDAFPHLVAVQRDGPDEAIDHLRVHAYGEPEVVPLTPTMCAGDRPDLWCRGGLVRALLIDPERDEWLTFHKLTTYDPKDASGRKTAWFYSRREVAPPRPLGVSAPFPLVSPLPGCRGAITEPHPLDEACLRWMSTCGARATASVGVCIEQYLRASEETRTAFIAAEPACAAGWVPPPPAPSQDVCEARGDRCVDDRYEICGDGPNALATLACHPIGEACVIPADPTQGEPGCGNDTCPDLGWDHVIAEGGERYRGLCQGDKVVVRVHGSVRHVSCGALGRGPCRMEQAPNAPGLYAGCGDPVQTTDPGGPGLSAGPLERACARAAICSPATTTLATCLERFFDNAPGTIDDAHDARYQAFLAATTCAELAAADPYLVRPADGCAASGDGVRCVEGAAVSCTGGEVQAVTPPCTLWGAACTIDGSTAVCAGPDGVCSDGPGCTATGDRCTAGETVGALTIGFDGCTARGLACAPAVRGGDACTTPLAACTTGYEAEQCVGDTRMRCVAPGLAVPVAHCDRLPGFVCAPNLCAPLVADCQNEPAQCDGEVLRYCHRGSRRSVDCASLGGTCVVGASGATCASE